MTAINKLLNLIVPSLTLVLIPTLMIPFIFYKLFLYAKKLVQTENMARKVVLITGAASGIGEELAYEYARRGANLSLVDIRKDKLLAVADKSRSLGSNDVTIIGADVSKVEDCKRFVDETVNYFGRLDHLVNNAGICWPVRVENFPNVSELTPIMDINFWGAVYCTSYAIPHLKKSQGRIIVIASIAGWCPISPWSIYNASKAAVINFFETLRIELGWTIGITIATPGLIKTDLALRSIDDEPILGRFPTGSASECAKAIVRSAFRGNNYVTYPSWANSLLFWKVLYPQVWDWGNRLIFEISPNTSSDKNGNLFLSENPELKSE